MSTEFPEETRADLTGIWNVSVENSLSVQRVFAYLLSFSRYTRVVHPHDRSTSIRLPNHTGAPSSTALSLVPFLRLCLLSTLSGPGRVQRRVNANFTRSITFSTWIIRCSSSACSPRHAVSRSSTGNPCNNVHAPIRRFRTMYLELSDGQVIDTLSLSVD